MMRGLFLHRRFFIGLWGLVFLALASFVFPALYVWVLWMLCVFGVLAVVDLCLLYGVGQRLEAGRVTADKYSNGEDNRVAVRVGNRYPFRVQVTLVDEAPVELQRRDIRLKYALAPGEEVVRTYALRPVRRGVLRFGRIRAFVSSPLALVERCYSFDGEQEVAVYPAFSRLRQYELLALAGVRPGDGVQKVRTVAVSSAFDQIKPYVQGDDPRAVNWKATAKCNRLMVNSYTEERSQQVYCVLDKGRTMQSPFNGMTILDYAINATLALSDIVLKKGDRAGLLTFSDKVGSWVKADARSLQLNGINEVLYGQQTDFLESDFEQLCVTVSRRIPTRSLLVLFTNFDTLTGMKRHLPALSRLAKSHLLLVVLFENTEINRTLARPADSLQEVYFKVTAGSFVSEKRRIAGELRKAGISTLLTEPEGLTLNAINAYLALKARGRI